MTCKNYASPALQAQYGGQGCSSSIVSASNLPFTGFDGGLFLIVAVALVASGTVLRRAGRKLA